MRHEQSGEDTILQESSVNKDKVFVVHGRNKIINRDFFAFLRSLGLRPIEWSEAVETTGQGSPYIGDVLEMAFSSAQAIVILMTPDDEARLKPTLQSTEDAEYEKRLTGQPRPNVLFEAGMAFGRNPQRTVIVQVGKMKPFSDIEGRHVVRLTSAPKRRREIANRLRTAGCAVNDTGTDWLSAGNFELQDDEEEISQEPAETEFVFQPDAVRMVRELLARYRTERDSDPIGIDGGKEIVDQALDTIHVFLSQVDEKEQGALHAKLSDFDGRFAKLMRHELVMDGGRSFQKFWQSADEAFEGLGNLMELRQSDL
jgi:predicted nucleotide-binding protein